MDAPFLFEVLLVLFWYEIPPVVQARHRASPDTPPWKFRPIDQVIPSTINHFSGITADNIWRKRQYEVSKSSDHQRNPANWLPLHLTSSMEDFWFPWNTRSCSNDLRHYHPRSRAHHHSGKVHVIGEGPMGSKKSASISEIDCNYKKLNLSSGNAFS